MVCVCVCVRHICVCVRECTCLAVLSVITTLAALWLQTIDNFNRISAYVIRVTVKFCVRVYVVLKMCVRVHVCRTRRTPTLLRAFHNRSERVTNLTDARKRLYYIASTRTAAPYTGRWSVCLV